MRGSREAVKQGSGEAGMRGSREAGRRGCGEAGNRGFAPFGRGIRPAVELVGGVVGWSPGGLVAWLSRPASSNPIFPESSDVPVQSPNIVN